MELTFAQVVEAIGAKVVNCEPIAPETRIAGWSIDSRTIHPGDLFFAIKGEKFDGHDFIASVRPNALAAVVSRSVPDASLPLLVVPDVLVALQELAHFARRNWNRTVIGITGSAGKTSTKDIVAELLSIRYRAGKTVGNFNNHIGLPLSILRLPDDAEVAVLEMGMNHAGEIRTLARIAEPQIGVVTNVGYAHVEAFDSIDAVAAAKRELVESLPASGVAVLNADDARVIKFRHVHKGRTVTYGFSEQADVRAVQLEAGPAATSFTVHGTRFQTSLSGRHSVLNILAGLAVAQVLGIDLPALTSRVENLRPGVMRGQRSVHNGMTVLNDSYNSNPEAARSMLDVLRQEPAQRRIAVLGEMLELGPMTEQLHRELGAYIARAGVEVLVGVCGASRFTVDEAVRSGFNGRAAFFFADPASAGDFLKDFVKPGDAILFKGSRGTHVEQALAKLDI